MNEFEQDLFSNPEYDGSLTGAEVSGGYDSLTEGQREQLFNNTPENREDPELSERSQNIIDDMNSLSDEQFAYLRDSIIRDGYSRKQEENENPKYLDDAKIIPTDTFDMRNMDSKDFSKLVDLVKSGQIKNFNNKYEVQEAYEGYQEQFDNEFAEEFQGQQQDYFSDENIHNIEMAGQLINQNIQLQQEMSQMEANYNRFYEIYNDPYQLAQYDEVEVINYLNNLQSAYQQKAAYKEQLQNEVNGFMNSRRGRR